MSSYSIGIFLAVFLLMILAFALFAFINKAQENRMMEYERKHNPRYLLDRRIRAMNKWKAANPKRIVRTPRKVLPYEAWVRLKRKGLLER